MKYLTCLFIALLVYNGHAQQKRIDSLEQKLKTQNEKNTERLNTLSMLASEYDIINPSRGLEYSNEAILLAKQLNLKDKLAASYKCKAQNLHALSKDSLALELYDMSATLYTELNSLIEVGKITFNQGLIYYGRSDFDKVDQHNEAAYKIFEKEKDSALMAAVLNSIGINQMQRSLYLEALDTYLKASSIYERQNKTENRTYAGILTNVGLLYSRLEKFDLALEYYSKSITLTKKIGYDLGTANALTNIGTVYDLRKKPKKALPYYYKAYNIMKRIQSRFGMASALTNIGITQINLENYDSAVKELKNSIVLFENLEDIYNLAIVHQNIGLAILKNPKSTIKSWTIAKIHLQKALSYAEETENIQNQVNTLDYLSQLEVKLKNYKRAYSHYREAMNLNDSILSFEKKEEIAKLQANYENQKKEALLKAKFDKENAINEAEIKRQKLVKNVSITGGSGFVLLSIMGFILYRRKRNAVLKSKEAQFKVKVSDTELKALRSQMNPHFIFNSLNSIGDYILKNNTQAASDYLGKFSKLMRMTLENSEKKEVTLEEDIALLKTYIDIERKRFNNSFDYTIEVESDIDIENILIPPMILQPFIENSIIHGITNKGSKGNISIKFKSDMDMLICSVDDDGIGRTASKRNEKKEHKSFGIAITKSRIEIINKLKNTSGDIKVIDKDKGTRVEVSLPLQLAF